MRHRQRRPIRAPTRVLGATLKVGETVEYALGGMATSCLPRARSRSTASARIAEMVLCDERAAIAIGSCHPAFGVTLSLPTLIGRAGAVAVLQPELSPDERIALEKSAEILRTAR